MGRYFGLSSFSVECYGLKENLSAPIPSEHPPSKRENMFKRFSGEHWLQQ